MFVPPSDHGSIKGGHDMSENMGTAPGLVTLGEIKEFAGFASGSQRYIRRSLDVAFDGRRLAVGSGR